MSQETRDWLSRYTLIGFTDKRGRAWHWRQGDGNHFTGAIPLETVRERLFFWKPLEARVQAVLPDHQARVDALIEGSSTFEQMRRLLNEPLTDPTRKAIVRPRSKLGPAKVLATPSKDYRVHGYDEWLIKNVELITDSDLEAGSAGLLRDGAQAFVQFELPENVTTPEGVEFRTFISAATSLDGSMATTYKTGNDLIVCDNTLHSAHGSANGRIKIRHSARSLSKIADVRQALDLVHTESEAFAKEVAELTSIKVDDRDWARFLDQAAPLDPDGPKRSISLARSKRDTLTQLYQADQRVAPWKGTAWGVLQATNTYNQHNQTVRGATRAERARTRFLKGDVDRDDGLTLDILQDVLN